MSSGEFQDGAGRGGSEAVNVNRMHAPIDREQDEPRDGYEPVPLLWILNALALAIGCGWYLGSQSNNFDPIALDGGREVRSASVAATQPSRPNPLTLGRRVYNQCMACHQPDGRGLEAQIPPLAGSEWVAGEPRVLARILLQGMHQDVIVSGKRYNGLMPAWGRLDDASIAGVLTYIRSAWDNDAAAIAPELIAQERFLTQGRVMPWTMTELSEDMP